jgi:hypothetical protein
MTVAQYIRDTGNYLDAINVKKSVYIHQKKGLDKNKYLSSPSNYHSLDPFVDKMRDSIQDNKTFTNNKDLVRKFARNIETDEMANRTNKERVQMLKCMKQELRRHSYLTMSKNVSTAE